MPVLKAMNHQPFTKDAIVLDLGDLGRQAARLRMQAEAKAAELVTAAEQQAAELVASAEAVGLERGYAAGHAKGLAEGREKGRAEALAAAKAQLEQVQTAWIDVAQQLDNGRKGMLLEAKQSVLEFALKVAEKLVHRVVEVDPTVVVDQVTSALCHVTRSLDVTVAVNPADRPLLEQALPELMREFSRLGHIALSEDASVSRGGCVVSYGQGEVDATIEKQLSRIVDLILPGSGDGDGDDGADGGGASARPMPGRGG